MTSRLGAWEGGRAIGMHEMQDIIHKERQDSQGAADAWDTGGSSRRQCYPS